MRGLPRRWHFDLLTCPRHAAPAKRVALFVTCLTDQSIPASAWRLPRSWNISAVRWSSHQRKPAAGSVLQQRVSPRSAPVGQADGRYLWIIRLRRHAQRLVLCDGAGAVSSIVGGDGDWEQPMHRLAMRTFEFVEFLDKVLKVDFSQFKLPGARSVTYHYTCHLRGLGVKDEGVRLLRQIATSSSTAGEDRPMLRLRRHVAVKYPAISGAIVDDKVKLHCRRRCRYADLQRHRLYDEHRWYVPSSRNRHQRAAYRRADGRCDGH